MPQRWTLFNRLSKPGSDSLHKLLGDLEVEIMERMWQRAESGGRGEATVRDIATDLQHNRQIAYTTVMTVMGNLAEKGLLDRLPLDKKTNLYRVALSREQFLQRSSQQMVEALLADFGDFALAQFIEAVEHVDPERLQRLVDRLSTTATTRAGADAHAEATASDTDDTGPEEGGREVEPC